MLRELASSWVIGNCPNPGLQRDFLERVDDAEQQRLNCYFVIGPKNTKSRQAYLVHCHSGELFVFALTKRQATSLKVAEAGMKSTFTEPIEMIPEGLPFSITLDRLVIENQGQLKTTEPFHGQLHYQMTGFYREPWCVSLEYALPGLAHIKQWSMPEVPLQEAGTIEFSFSGVGDLGKITTSPWRGTTAVFVSLYSMTTPNTVEDRARISSMAAILIDVS